MSSQVNKLPAGLLLALALAAPVPSCRTTSETGPAGTHLAVVRTGQPVRAWKLVSAGSELGAVVQFDAPVDPDAPAGRFYSVRNPWQQELGTIDAQGRAWRFVPHEREARWVGTGTLLEGARAILAPADAEAAPAELVEVPLATLEAHGQQRN